MASFGLECYLTVACDRSLKLVPMVFFFFVGHVNVAPRHLTAEAETLLSATLIHEVSWLYILNSISIGSSVLCSSSCF